VQPSEAAKLALILWLAYSLEKKRERMKSFSIGMLPHFLMAGFLMVLCLKQPDFGGAVVLLFLTFALLFVAGARLGYLLGAAMLGGVFAAWAVRFTSYRWERMLAWFNMAEHRQDLAYQPFQSVMSFGSGEVTGLGLGKGLQVLYLPEAHTDFISAIIGEELGFIGILAMAGVYLLIVARGVRAALQAEDEYGSYIAFGISVLFGAQALVNLAVAMAMLPTKGLTLPFVSYGGSSLLVCSAAMGVLLAVSRGKKVANPKLPLAGPDPEASAVLVTQAGEGVLS
jgi:cell division protein FtsW